jgi:hypothetical protein
MGSMRVVRRGLDALNFRLPAEHLPRGVYLSQ